MHIADGILSPEVCLGTVALAGATVAYGLRKLNGTLSDRTLPLTGMMAALVFAGQMVNFPIGVPVSGHLLGGVLAAVMVGPWAGCVALAMVLFIQMALFSDGGWLSYGANVLNMGVVGSLGGYAIYAAVRRIIGGAKGIVIGAVVASWVSVLAASTLFCLEFWLSHPRGEFPLTQIFALMTSFHSVIGIGEGAITGMVLTVVVAQRPDLIYTPAARPGTLAGTGRFLWTGAVAALAVAAFLSPFASEYADGLEAVAERTEFQQLISYPRPLLLADYEIPLPGVDAESGFWHRLSVSLSGIFGTTAVMAMSWGFACMMKPRVAAATVEPVSGGREPPG
jgi:cobalt/nickel transport system permease protein